MNFKLSVIHIYTVVFCNLHILLVYIWCLISWSQGTAISQLGYTHTVWNSEVSQAVQLRGKMVRCGIISINSGMWQFSLGASNVKLFCVTHIYTHAHVAQWELQFMDCKTIPCLCHKKAIIIVRSELNSKGEGALSILWRRYIFKCGSYAVALRVLCLVNSPLYIVNVWALWFQLKDCCWL